MAFLSPALSKLRNEVDAQAPNRSTASDGWIGDPAHASRHSDHNPEGDGSVDAVDITHDPAAGADMNAITDTVKDDPRMDAEGSYIIWNRRIWSGSSWATYTGSNGHTVHAHFSIGDSVQNDTSPWLGQQGDWLMGAQEDLTNVIQNQGKLTRAQALAIEARMELRIAHLEGATDGDLEIIKTRLTRIRADIADLEAAVAADG
jgi:hypothetical protein